MYAKMYTLLIVKYAIILPKFHINNSHQNILVYDT